MKISFSEIENPEDIKKYPPDTEFVLEEEPPKLPVPEFLRKGIEDNPLK